MFNHPAAQANPWLWSLVHGVAVLLACIGVMLFWRRRSAPTSRPRRLRLYPLRLRSLHGNRR
jgi:hypothetical protein